MREISAEVASLLKSRAMIGENKPSYEVTVEGLNSGYDWQESYTAYNPHTGNADYHPSCVKLDDGRILYMYSRGIEPGAIYQAYISDFQTFITQNNSVENEEVVFDNLYYPRATLFKSPEGNLFFVLVYTKTTTENIAKLEIYKSELGDGSDWNLYSTLNSVNWGGNVNDIYVSAKRPGVSVPYFLNGRWILGHVNFSNFEDYLAANFAISTSDDNGFTWTIKATFMPSQKLDNISRNFAYFKNELWTASSHFNTFGAVRYFKSSDNGDTWTTVIDEEPFYVGVSYMNPTVFSDGSTLYSLNLDQDAPAIIRETKVIPTALNDFMDNGKILPLGSNINYDTYIAFFNIDNKLVCMSGSQSEGIGVRVLGIDLKSTELPVRSISILRNKNMAGSLNLAIDNKNGEWSPDNTVNQNVLFPNKQVTVKQGYGNALVQTFSGLIDRIEMTTFPQELKLSVRDKLKLALDQIITCTYNSTHVILFQLQPIETIFSTLCNYAGLTIGNVETTGISITKTFSWETYADCFQWLADLVGYEYGADEEGKVYFRKDITPATPIVAYEFKEGEDIISLGYIIDDNDIYSKVVVYGKDENDNVIFAQKEYISKNYYNVLSQKFLKIDVSEASTVEQLQSIADRAEMLMRSRVRTVNFAAIAVPWLQVGDVIRVVESSATISEIYRITDLSTTYDSNGYTMQITCYHHSA